MSCLVFHTFWPPTHEFLFLLLCLVNISSSLHVRWCRGCAEASLVECAYCSRLHFRMFEEVSRMKIWRLMKIHAIQIDTLSCHDLCLNSKLSWVLDDLRGWQVWLGNLSNKTIYMQSAAIKLYRTNKLRPSTSLSCSQIIAFQVVIPKFFSPISSWLTGAMASATPQDVKQIFRKYADGSGLVDRAWLLRVICRVAPRLSQWLGEMVKSFWCFWHE